MPSPVVNRHRRPLAQVVRVDACRSRRRHAPQPPQAIPASPITHVDGSGTATGLARRKPMLTPLKGKSPIVIPQLFPSGREAHEPLPPVSRTLNRPFPGRIPFLLDWRFLALAQSVPDSSRRELPNAFTAQPAAASARPRWPAIPTAAPARCQPTNERTYGYLSSGGTSPSLPLPQMRIL
jgi:hypothetical protein